MTSQGCSCIAIGSILLALYFAYMSMGIAGVIFAIILGGIALFILGIITDN